MPVKTSLLILFCMFCKQNLAQTTHGSYDGPVSGVQLYLNQLDSTLSSEGYEWISYSFGTFYVLHYNGCNGLITHKYYLSRKDDKLSLKKIVICSDSLVENSTIAIKYDSGIFDTISRHYADISTDEILHSVYKTKNNGEEGFVPVISTLHETFYSISYRKGQDKYLAKDIMATSVRKEFIPGIKNLNYEYNKTTWVYKLWQMLQTITGEKVEEIIYK